MGMPRLYGFQFRWSTITALFYSPRNHLRVRFSNSCTEGMNEIVLVFIIDCQPHFSALVIDTISALSLCIKASFELVLSILLTLNSKGTAIVF
jgi:hypothetical protein